MISHPKIEDAWSALREVKDPEIPVLSLVDLRIVRDVRVEDSGVTVRMVPTFAGCPALDLMKREVEQKLLEMGFDAVVVEIDRSGAWSTDELAADVRNKMKSFGITAPPQRRDSLAATLSLPVECPHCGSMETQLEGYFGSTLCKQLFFCGGCRQSFERFKPL